MRLLRVSVFFLCLALTSGTLAQTAPAELTAPSPSAQALFGIDVSASADGNKLLVGARSGGLCPGGGNVFACGVAYVFVRQGTGWALEGTLNIPELGTAGFGRSVALSPDGTAALVGAPETQCVGLPLPGQCGAVYAYSLNGGAWTFEAKLEDEVFQGPTDQFGFSLALSNGGDTALVGVPFNDCEGGLICGSVFVYRRDGGAWAFETQLQAADTLKGQLGYDVAISPDGNTVLAGANTAGAAYLFVRNGGGWMQQAKLTTSGGAAMSFGVSVALAGRVALVGATGASCAAGTNCGAVFAFEESGGVWTERQKLTAPTGGVGDNFGSRVALSAFGNTGLIVNAFEDCAAGANCGAVYRTTRSGSVWTLPEKLFDFVPGGDFNTQAALAISADGRTGFAGVSYADCAAGEDCGLVYIFSAASAIEVPTLSSLGLVLMTLVLAGGGAWLLSRRRRA